MYVYLVPLYLVLFRILFDCITHEFRFRWGILCERRFNHINNWITLASHRTAYLLYVTRNIIYQESFIFRNSDIEMTFCVNFGNISNTLVPINRPIIIKFHRLCDSYFYHFIFFPYFHCPFAVHPVINVRNQLVGSPFEKDVTIECNVEASPKSINYWIKDVKDGKCLRLSTFVAVCMQFEFASRQLGKWEIRVFYVIHWKRTLFYSVWTFQP